VHREKTVAQLSGRIASNRPRSQRGGRPDLIHARIIAAISEQRLHPGVRLEEEQIAAIFAVSRTIVRRALANLAQDRGVAQRLNRGAVIAMPTRHEARDVFAARRLIEASLAARLAKAEPRGAIARLRRHVAREYSARRRGIRPAPDHG